MPVNTARSDTMFPNRPWNLQMWKNYCNETYGIVTNENYIINKYGGKTEGFTDMNGYSNIFFSNGRRDPWSAGSVLISPNK